MSDPLERIANALEALAVDVASIRRHLEGTTDPTRLTASERDLLVLVQRLGAGSLSDIANELGQNSTDLIDEIDHLVDYGLVQFENANATFSSTLAGKQLLREEGL